MASEAQRLIGISLTKIAQSRTHRGGVSLHKNLLVATVLQKARYIFMEEAYNMVHYQQQQSSTTSVQPQPAAEPELVGLTAEEATGLPDDVQESSSSDNFHHFLHQPSCVKCSTNQQNKENHPPYSPELTYLDLDKSSNVLRERSNSSSSSCLKRRRAVAEWETEEAVQSILPKRTRHEEGPEDEEDDEHDSVFLDEATSLAEQVTREHHQEAEKTSAPSMEIDRITSLVSIFSFSIGDTKLNRSMSTPDLCAAQAKDTGDTLQQRPFLAMTV